MVPVVPPVLIIKSRAVPSPSIVEPKVTLLSVVVNVVSVLKVTAPVYVCVEEVVTFAPRLEVVDTDKVDNPVAAPSRFNAPVMIKALVPPATVVPKLTVDAVNVLVPPDKVTAPVYVCVDVVVTFAPRLEVVDTDKVDNPVAAPSRFNAPVMIKALVPPATVVPKLTVDAVNVLVPPDKVTAPVYVCVEEVVTFAPKLEVEDTSNDVALVIAAFKSKVPVISITPKVRVPPTIPSNCTSDAVMVRLLVSSVSELTVVSKVI